MPLVDIPSHNDRQHENSTDIFSHELQAKRTDCALVTEPSCRALAAPPRFSQALPTNATGFTSRPRPSFPSVPGDNVDTDARGDAEPAAEGGEGGVGGGGGGGDGGDGEEVETGKPAAYRVLIVEDNLVNQEVLRRQLNREGCVTHVADNGQQALDFVRSSSSTGERWRLDLVLMDMEMPVMDGCTATRKIRELERSGELAGHVPIMGISANARPEQVAMMAEAGMDDAIPKPFRVAGLLDRFAQLMCRLSAAAAVANGEKGGGQ